MSRSRRPAAARRTTKRPRPARARRRVRLDTDERRAQLLALGKHAFAERTYDDVSIDDIARTAGISKGLLYHYFPTKRDLYVAGLREIGDELVARTRDVPQDGTPLDRMRAGIDAYLDFVLAQATGYTALMRGGIGSDPEVVAVLDGIRGRLIDQILDKAETSPIAPVLGHPLIKLSMRGWIGFVEAATIEWLASRAGDRAGLRDLFVEMLLGSLRALGAKPV